MIDGTAGWHDCLMCPEQEQRYPGGGIGPIVRWGLRRRRVRGYGHFLIATEGRAYMAPVLILHYIIDHDYSPPAEFQRAVLEGRFLSEDDLEWSPAPSP